MNKTLRVLSVLFLSSLVIAACNKDDDNPEPADVIASFQYEISADNWSDVVFTNYSQNASTYAWDFGDGNTSTEEGPTHSYAAGGTYEVMLTATGEAGHSLEIRNDQCGQSEHRAAIPHRNGRQGVVPRSGGNCVGHWPWNW